MKFAQVKLADGKITTYNLASGADPYTVQPCGNFVVLPCLGSEIWLRSEMIDSINIFEKEDE